MKKIGYYLDTTIFSFIFAEDAPEKREITKRLLDQLRQDAEALYVSDEVIREISRASESKSMQLIEAVQGVNPFLLAIHKEVEELAERYIREGVIPEKYRGDALHIAAAVVNEIEVIVSWNFEHIVKLKTRRMVNAVNRLLGYREIEICSPEEVIDR